MDSSVWLEIFLEGKLREISRKSIGRDAVVSTVTYFEVYRKLKQRFSESRALEAMGALSPYRQLDVTQDIALSAADLSIEYGLGMADSLVLAQARYLGVPLLTLDNDFSKIPGARVLR
ncbi:MAG: PIN domain-containing protein [Bdellovibrionota bacterium]